VEGDMIRVSWKGLILETIISAGCLHMFKKL